jgi:MoaA/NifB/PqqE/SkfB family radical SAM enzyme
MCGNLGDPIIAKDTLEIFKYFREINPDIWLGMHTNGGAKSSEWWKELSSVFNKKGSVTFSIDGLEDTNHLYRQNVIWKKIEESFKSFINSGGRAKWDFIVFEHNQHQVNIAKQIAKEHGFEKFSVKKTGRFLTTNSEVKTMHQAINFKGKETVILKKPKEIFQNNALKNQKDLIHKYGSMGEYFNVTKINCKVKEEKNLFISAEGLALPCCWTAGRMYKWWHNDPTVEHIWDFINKVGGKNKLNAKEGLKKVFDSGFFHLIEKSWEKENINEGKLKVCAMKCGSEFDPFKTQWE